MAVMHGASSPWEYVILILWLFGVKCAAIDLSGLAQLVGDQVLTSMEANGITVKAAAITCGMDESTFRKALKGESYRHITIVHMLMLGPKFYVHLSASLTWLVAKRHLEEIVDTVNVRRGA